VGERLATRRPIASIVVCCLTFLAGAMLLSPRAARAEIKIVERNGWVLTTEGRLNSFLSVARGDAIPLNEQNYTGLDDEATPDHTLESARVRTGFIASVLGFDLRSQLSETVSVHGRASLWMLASAQRSEGDEPAVDAREAFFKLEGPFGGFLAGRAMGLFSRGAILGDYELEHAYGLGHPCATKVASVGACGHAGFGVLFPGFHAGLVYNTPVLAGLQISAGLFDPAALNEGAYRRTPLPRAEAEAVLSSRHLRAFVGVLWQPLSRNNTVTDPMTMMNVTQEQNVTATAISYGGLVSVGPLAVGGSGYYGKGLGLYTPWPVAEMMLMGLSSSGV
jgi:hypothetical protein